MNNIRNHKIGTKAGKILGISILTLALGACTWGQIITTVGQVLVFIGQHIKPPASALANFDASQASDNVSFNNISLSSHSGTVTITIKDQSTGNLLGQQAFNFTINSTDQLKFSNPSAVTNWVRSFSNYPGYVDVGIKAGLNINPPPSGQSGSVASTAVYQGIPYSSSSITISGGTGGGCRFCKRK